MYLDPLRQLQAWLTDATKGVNALRAAVPADVGDAALPAVTVLNAADTPWVARGLIDRSQVGSGALLLIQPPAEGDAVLIEPGRDMPNQAQVDLVVRYAVRKSDAAKGLGQAWQTLRVAARSILKQASRDTATRNTTTIGPVLGLRYVAALDERDDDFVVDALIVTLGVWDAWALAATTN